jgi:hypothetical protein
MALLLDTEIMKSDERIRVLVSGAEPAGIVPSAPGVRAITGAAIISRPGGPTRFGRWRLW